MLQSGTKFTSHGGDLMISFNFIVTGIEVAKLSRFGAFAASIAVTTKLTLQPRLL